MGERGDDGRAPPGRWRYFLAGIATFFIAPLLLVIPYHLGGYSVGLLVFWPFLLFVILVAGMAFALLDRFGLRSWLLSLALGALLGAAMTLGTPHIVHDQVLSPTVWQTMLRFIIAGAAGGGIFHLIAPKRKRRG